MTTRGRAAAARVAHNHKVGGSSPPPATKKNDSSNDGSFFLSWSTRIFDAKRSEVKTASGSLQGSQLFKTGFERCCDGVAERDRFLSHYQA